MTKRLARTKANSFKLRVGQLNNNYRKNAHKLKWNRQRERLVALTLFFVRAHVGIVSKHRDNSATEFADGEFDAKVVWGMRRGGE